MSFGSFEVELALVPLDELHIHEEVVPAALSRIVTSLRETRIFMHPVMCDKHTGVVLDGTHRVVAARVLGLRSVPCCLVDYQDERIRLERWFRRIRCDPEQVVKYMRVTASELGLSIDVTDDWESELRERDCVCALVLSSRAYVIRGQEMSAYSAFRLLKCIEERLKSAGIGYDFIPSGLWTSDMPIIATRSLTKEDVITHARRGEIFPPKTTRHIFPVRALYLRVPLHLCEKRGAGREFLLHVISREQVLFEARLTIDRFYEEDRMVALL